MSSGADQAPDLGVDLHETWLVLELIELDGGDVAGGVLCHDDGVKNTADLLVDEVR
jgi:hypothetical protein